MRRNKILLMMALLLLTFALIDGVLVPGLSSQPVVDLKKGLVAYWKLDEGEGDIAFDETENHNDGILKCRGEECSPPKWVEGKIGYVLEFDGVDDYVDCGNHESLRITDAITIEAWVKLNGAQGSGLFVAHSWTDYGLRYAHGKYAFSVRGQDGVEDYVYSSVTPLSEWVHLVGTYDSSTETARIYVNGELGGEAVFSGNGEIFLTSGNVQMGGTSEWSNFNGLIDEVRIYNRVLTESEVERLYEMGVE